MSSSGALSLSAAARAQAASRLAEQPADQPEDDPAVVVVRAQGPDGPRSYEFPPETVRRYPKLMETGTRFLRLDGVYEVLCGHPITLVADSALHDADDRARFLYVCSQLEVPLSDGDLRHICECTGMGDQIRSCRDFFGSIGQTIRQIFGSKQVGNHLVQIDDHIREVFPGAMAAGVNSERLVHAIVNKEFSFLYRQNVAHPPVVQHVLDSISRKFLGGGFRP